MEQLLHLAFVTDSLIKSSHTSNVFVHDDILNLSYVYNSILQ